MYQYPDYLMHYGVKVMKWGVRRAQKKAARAKKKKIKQFDKKLNDIHTQISLYNKAADAFNPELDRINKKWKNVDVSDTKSKNFEKYATEVGKKWTSLYKDLAIKELGADPKTDGYEYVDNLLGMHDFDIENFR